VATVPTFLKSVTQQIWRCVRSPKIGWALWIVNIATFIGLVAWIFCDGQFASSTDMLRVRAISVLERGTGAGAYTWYAGRVLLLTIAVIAAAVSSIGIFLSLFVGAHPHRRVRSWFAFTLLVAAWLTLLGSWHELAWHGQTFRMQRRLAGFETIAESLRSDWPTIDGERTHMGQFMAYPIGRPMMLMMLTKPDVPGTATSFATVEHGDDGTLRFELTGDEPDGWLEWHPAGSVPKSFVGGLQDERKLDRYAPLADGWYLARYSRGLIANAARGPDLPADN